MKKSVLLLCIAICSALVMSACQTAPVQPDQVMTLEEFFSPASGKVQSTADNILVRGVRTKYAKGHLIADFKLYNDRGRRNVINYRVQWLDNEGMLASPSDTWQTTALEGHQEIIVTLKSPNTKAVDYRLELQTN
jgi:uncharacterized protein YcfL